MQKMYYLLDLERTLTYSVPYFWKGNRHGYTRNVIFAGLFVQEYAEKIVNQDRDGATIMIRQDLVIKILGEDLKQRERIT
jgi:hypothetical protein